MVRSLKLCAVALCLALAASGGHGRGAGAQGGEPTPTPASLTAQELRGRAVYQRGESPSGRELAAEVAGSELSAASRACAECHGARGEGKTEAGITAGALTWAHLVKPGGHRHPSGRRHRPFDESSFRRSLADGLDPDDNELHAAMPRYRMAPETAADLIAYLKRVGAEGGPAPTGGQSVSAPRGPTR